MEETGHGAANHTNVVAAVTEQYKNDSKRSLYVKNSENDRFFDPKICPWKWICCWKKEKLVSIVGSKDRRAITATFVIDLQETSYKCSFSTMEKQIAVFQALIFLKVLHWARTRNTIAIRQNPSKSLRTSLLPVPNSSINIDIKRQLTVMKPLHVKWLIDIYNTLTSAKGKKVVTGGWRTFGILGSVKEGAKICLRQIHSLILILLKPVLKTCLPSILFRNLATYKLMKETLILTVNLNTRTKMTKAVKKTRLRKNHIKLKTREKTEMF